MIYEFPDFDTLYLAINSVVPREVSLAPAAAVVDDAGKVRVAPTAALPKKAQAALRKLGVQTSEGNGTPGDSVTCWPQLLPLRREGAVPNLPAQAPVLFELTEPTLLSGLVAEMLRLGNDRQSFRYVKDGRKERVLLRVIGPPFYSLLRALEATDAEPAPRAYLERAPGVWVQVGWTHPLVDLLKPPPGQIMLLRPPREWTTFEDAPYQDIYEILDFALPSAPVQWQAKDAGPRLQVPLRLVPGGTTEPAELWVLREAAFDQVDALVRNAPDPLLNRLSFAVGSHDGQTSIVLRVRPSKSAPPSLTLQDAVEFRPFWKLPNLFIPRGRGLQPPLRRDAVRSLLAADPDLVVWLYPQGEHQFVPECLPDASFRPLSDWVDYVLDRDHQALQQWIEAASFEFAAYVCKDDAEPAPKPPREKKPARGRRSMLEEDAEADDEALTQPVKVVDRSRKKTTRKDEDDFTPLLDAKPSELKVKLTELEQQFEAIDGPLDEPARQELWLQMAPINVALDKVSDAAICWLNAVWNQDGLPPDWVASWARAETKAPGREVDPVELDRLLGLLEPMPADVRAVAASVVLAASDPAAGKQTIVTRLPRIQTFLEKHEAKLGVRAVWLAWSSMARLTSGDVLALARTRDRLLERLLNYGLSPEHDLPSFLRFAGEQSSERYRLVRDRVARLRELAEKWIKECYVRGPQNTHMDKAMDATQAYKDLMFSFGLAKLGEAGECHRLKQQATQTLKERDDVHDFLLNAFVHRIDQALAGRPHTGPLPAEFQEHLQSMAKDAKKSNDVRTHAYIIDRLRGESRILEPHEKIDAYRTWRKTADELGEQLDQLYTQTDRVKLEAELTRLLIKHKKSAELLRVLTTALHVASHLSEAFVVNILGRLLALREVLATVQSLHELEHNAKVLERALFLAAHFDRAEYLQQIVTTFFQLLESQKGNNFTEAVDGLAQCLRSLRKLGLKQEIDGLMQRMADLLMKDGADLAELRARTPNVNEWADILRALLQLAGGWLYFGRTEKALPFLDEARALLFQEDQKPAPPKRSKLARAYAEALGQAPVDLALKRFEELFRKLGSLADTFTTNSHYSLSQLQVVEAVVRAVVSEDFAVGQNVRRWLDEDEFLVRRRIHKDLRALMSQSGL